ncbi:MAG: hypothetical protein LBT37_04535 [Lactobacillaceae bacterium]|jgi:hypothetical protein|nr:hypothetical protein [Lactobacillaceae bacterium]
MCDYIAYYKEAKERLGDLPDMVCYGFALSMAQTIDQRIKPEKTRKYQEFNINTVREFNQWDSAEKDSGLCHVLHIDKIADQKERNAQIERELTDLEFGDVVVIIKTISREQSHFILKGLTKTGGEKSKGPFVQTANGINFWINSTVKSLADGTVFVSADLDYDSLYLPTQQFDLVVIKKFNVGKFCELYFK